MNIKMRELLFEKMYGGKIINFETTGSNVLYFSYFLVIIYFVILIMCREFHEHWSKLDIDA